MDSTPSLETQNPSSFVFPKHRKSHIKSNTFDALFRIFTVLGDVNSLAAPTESTGVRREEFDRRYENKDPEEDVLAEKGRESGESAATRRDFNSLSTLSNKTVLSSTVAENGFCLRDNVGANSVPTSNVSQHSVTLPLEVGLTTDNDATVDTLCCDKIGQVIQKEVRCEGSYVETEKKTDETGEAVALQSTNLNFLHIVANDLELRTNVDELVSQESQDLGKSLSLGNGDTVTSHKHDQLEIDLGCDCSLEVKLGSKQAMENEVFDCSESQAVTSDQGTQEKGLCFNTIMNSLVNLIDDKDTENGEIPTNVGLSYQLDCGESQAVTSVHGNRERNPRLDTIMNSFVNLIDNKDTEEGEIPADLGALCQSENLFPEPTYQFEGGKLDEVYSNGGLDKQVEVVSQCRRRNAVHLDDFSASCFVDTYGEEEAKQRGTTVSHVLISSPKVGTNEKEGKGVKRGLLEYNDALLDPEEVSKEFVVGNETNTSMAKEVKVGEKRKRTSSTKARKERKKQTRRKNRAELNKKHGIKRLKLQPLEKPKRKIDCMYFLKGRCQQGASCKFSHDLIPLTKSVACTHFARQECLKGDSCPYDHDLSKYPCHNFVKNGECGRGNACLFSHKILPLNGSLVAENVNKDEPNTVKKSDRSTNTPLRQKIIPHQTTDVLLKRKTPPDAPSSTEALTRNPVLSIPENIRRLPAQPPKGITFLSCVKPPSTESNKQLEILRRAPAQPPKGITFLSCVKPPSVESNKQLDILSIQPERPPKGISFLSSAKPPSIESKEQLGHLTPGQGNNIDLFGGKRLETTSVKPHSALMDNEPKVNSVSPISDTSKNTSMTVSNILQEFLYNGM